MATLYNSCTPCLCLGTHARIAKSNGWGCSNRSASGSRSKYDVGLTSYQGRVELASACKDFKRSYVNVYDTQIHNLKRERLRGEP